ncbi:MAG: Zn-dependent hydrolase [Parvibaculaceae bacterium]
MADSEGASFEALFCDLSALAAFGADEAGGISRTAFSPSFMAAQAWLARRMAEAGLDVGIDAAGNVIGRFGPPGPAVLCASHIDTVPNGGPLDGALGVLAGLEAFRVLRSHGHDFARALEIVAFADEEGEFHSLFGSRAMLGLLGPADIATAQGGKGRSLVAALREAGLDPQRITAARRPHGDFHSYVELHIEQGPVLERLGIAVGIVTGIVGIEVTEFRFAGRPDHSGTTPRDVRHDAWRAAVEFCAACYRLADASDPALRLNFGSLSLEPKALNVVPGKVRLRQELRHPDPAVLASVAARTRAMAEDCGRRLGVEAEWTGVSRDEPASMDRDIRELLRACADRRGIAVHDLPSGAGHDAQLFASVCPTAMLFVQSTGGRSHCPEESSPPEAVRQAVAVLTDGLGRLTGR